MYINVGQNGLSIPPPPLKCHLVVVAVALFFASRDVNNLLFRKNETINKKNPARLIEAPTLSEWRVQAEKRAQVPLRFIPLPSHSPFPLSHSSSLFTHCPLSMSSDEESSPRLPPKDLPPSTRSTRNQLTTEEKQARRAANAERRDALDVDLDYHYELWKSTVVAMAEEHGISEARAASLLGARITEGKQSRAATSYNAWQSSEIRRLNSGK